MKKLLYLLTLLTPLTCIASASIPHSSSSSTLNAFQIRALVKGEYFRLPQVTHYYSPSINAHLEEVIKAKTTETSTEEEKDEIFATALTDCFFERCGIAVPATTKDAQKAEEAHKIEVVFPDKSHAFATLQDVRQNIFEIGRNKEGRNFLLAFISLYEKNPALPKVHFGKIPGRVGNAGGEKGIMIVLGEKSEIPMPVYLPKPDSREGIDVVFRSFSLTMEIYYDLIQLFHRFEDEAEFMHRRSHIGIISYMFMMDPRITNPLIMRKDGALLAPIDLDNYRPPLEYIKGQKAMFRKAFRREVTQSELDTLIDKKAVTEAILKKLKEQFGNNEIIYYLFGIRYNSDKSLSYDPLNAASFSVSAYGCMQTGFWVPPSFTEAALYNVICNFDMARQFFGITKPHS